MKPDGSRLPHQTRRTIHEPISLDNRATLKLARKRRRFINITYELAYDTSISKRPSIMQILTASEARTNLYRLMDQSAESHQPIMISGKRTNSVLVSAEDWQAIQETLYLLSVPGMRESIKEGVEETVDDCAKELDW